MRGAGWEVGVHFLPFFFVLLDDLFPFSSLWEGNKYRRTMTNIPITFAVVPPIIPSNTVSESSKDTYGSSKGILIIFKNKSPPTQASQIVNSLKTFSA